MSKEKPIHIRILHRSDLQQFYFTFLEAFNDYSVDMGLDRKAFDRRMMDKLNIDWGLSVGAFSGDKMVGFIAHTSNTYQKQLYAYNGGTGVIPQYRGLGLTEHMYGLAIKRMCEMKINRCVLEVIDQNSSALAAYQKVGFEKTRLLRCYKLIRKVSAVNLDQLVVEALKINELKVLPDLTLTSFMDSWDQLSINKQHEKMILYRDSDEAIVGYCVFQPDSGRIARLWVRKENIRLGIGRVLMAAADSFSSKPLTVINVDQNNQSAHQFLIACGFENQINQWEMILQID